MTGKAGLKAGLIGTAVMVVWTVIGRFLPASGVLMWVSSGVSLLLYAGIGVLAGFFLSPPRKPGKGAGAGALAGPGQRGDRRSSWHRYFGRPDGQRGGYSGP